MQADNYKRHTPETIVRRRSCNGSGWGSRSPQQVIDGKLCSANNKDKAISLEKTEIMWVRQKRKELEIQIKEAVFVYLLGAIYWGGNKDTEIRRRITAGVIVRRKVEEVMGNDGVISHKLKGKVLTPCVTPAYMNNLQTNRETTTENEGLRNQLNIKNREGEP